MLMNLMKIYPTRLHEELTKSPKMNLFHPENVKLNKALQLLKKTLSHPPNNNCLNIKNLFQLEKKNAAFPPKAKLIVSFS